MNKGKSLQQLAREERDAIIWKLYCDGKTVRDIETIMNCAHQTAFSAIKRERVKHGLKPVRNESAAVDKCQI